MKIAVIGTINRDTIYPYRGLKIESYGGILYNLIALASLLQEKATLFPICNLGNDLQDTINQTLEPFHTILRKGIRIVPLRNNHAILRYTSPTQRKEYLENRVPPLTFKQVELSLKCDHILINFISGFDLSLETLKQLRDAFEGIIFIDIHSLTLGLAKDGTRFLRHLDDWTEWIRQGNIIQLNHSEAQILARQKLSHYDDLADFAKQILENGPHVVLVTLAEEGSVMAYKSDSSMILDRCPAYHVVNVDSTGCGDVFSAGFIAEYLRSQDPLTANRFANRVAGINCTLRGLEELQRIGEIVSAE